MVTLQSADSAFDIIKNKNTAVALGNFDGVHIAHQRLINLVVNAKCDGLIATVFNFKSHPENLINEKIKIKSITSNSQKQEIFEKLNIDIAIFESFDQHFMMLTPEQFVLKYIVNKLRAKLVVVGYHYRFGYKGSGDVKKLFELSKKYNFKLVVVDEIKLDNVTVSSTYIRNLIENGDVLKASEFLGRFFSLEATVEKGEKIGRTIGFPTINFSIKDEQIIPKNGVYVTFLSVEGREYRGVTNIGTKPTVNGQIRNIETHILDFNGDLYNKTLKINFVCRIRDEKKFDTLNQLKNQIEKDIEFSKKLNIFHLSQN